MRAALATLPWVEKDSIRTNTGRQEASFGFKEKKQFDLDAVKGVVEKSGRYKVSRVLKGPTDPETK